MSNILANGLRQVLSDEIVSAKASKGLTWDELSAGTGLSVTYVTAALLGQHPLPKAAAELIVGRLGLAAEAIRQLQCIPMRGGTAEVVRDPTIYRFYEILNIYGVALKALVHERFGDGVVSAVNFKIDIDKVLDPDGGARAVITLDGKFLPYNPF